MNFTWRFLLFSILVVNLALAAIEGLKCQRSEVGDVDQALFLQDFGPDGIQGPINITLYNSLQPGAVISIVSKSDVRGNINLVADDIYVLHVDARIKENVFVINTSKRLNVEWFDEVRVSNPVLKGVKATTTIVYEVEGFRIFINGREISFYKHRTDRLPSVITLFHDYVYKVLYLTTRETKKFE